MQRKQDGLVPVQKIRDASPQALHRFTQADQVNQLVSASESGPRSGLHGANDGVVFVAPQQPRQPVEVRSP